MSSPKSLSRLALLLGLAALAVGGRADEGGAVLRIGTDPDGPPFQIGGR